MNEDAKKIIRNLGAREIGLDEEFKFHCTMCGKCCIHREDILLNTKDVYGMAKELQLTPKEMLVKYCEVYIGEGSRIPVIRLKPHGSVHRCPLLKDRKCMVHNAKPVICAIYPLGRCMIAERKDEAGISAGRTQYILNKTDCGDNTETHTVREWLDSFGIPVEDEFFRKWQEIIVELIKTVPEMEKHMGRETMNTVWTAVLEGLYLNYDTEKDFMPQFERNVRDIRSMLNGGTAGKGGSDGNDGRK